MFKVLIVEDDEKICSIVSEYLNKWQFQTRPINEFHKVEEEFLLFNPHIILLDINLPFFDGYHWCSIFRRHSNVPIIFFSSRNEKMDIMMAINMGGDDFIQKPFSLELLVTKMNALLRRTYTYQSDQLDVRIHRDLTLNMKTASLQYNDTQIDLTKNEFKILALLLQHKNNIVTRDSIMRMMWENENFVDDNTLTVNVNRLRKKLNEHGLLDYIETKKGQGYMLK